MDKLAISSRKSIPPSTPDADSSIIEFTLARAEVLLRLMQHVENETDQKSIKDFVYYFGLLRKDTEFLCDGGMHKNRALRIMSDANQIMANKAAKSPEPTHTNPILVLLDDIFKNPDLVKEAEELLKGASEDEIDIKLCELLQLPSKNLSNEEYVKEENRLRDELGKAFEKRTGCTLNFGQGLSIEDLCIRVIIIMNYATKECEGYTGGLDLLDLMDLDNGCIHLWYKGLVTLSTITAGGPRTTYTKGVHDTRGIAFTDRLDMIPEQKDGYEDLFTNFCKEVRSTKTKMHLVNAIFLALKVHFLNMNDTIPAVLGTGAPVRDYLLNKNTDVRITPRVISLGWLVHSQKIMNKGGMLLQYSEEQIQEFSNTITRAYALLDPSVPVAADYSDIIGMFCGLYKLSDEQRAAIREARRQHGFASGKMRTEAGMLYAFLIEDGFNHDEAMEWILSELSEAHFNLYDACLRVGKMRTDAKEMYHKLMKKEGMTREKALDRIEKKLSAKHRNLYEGGLKTNDMTTEAKEMYHKLMKDENMTREIALTRIEKELSVKHRKLYERCSKSRGGPNSAKQQVRDKNDQNLQRQQQQQQQQQYLVEVPKGIGPGMQFTVTIESRPITVACPPDVQAGMKVYVQLPTSYQIEVPKGIGPGMQFNVMIEGQRMAVTCPPDVQSGMKVSVPPPLPITKSGRTRKRKSYQRKKFTEEEDLCLWKAYKEKGKKWSLISKENFNGERNGDDIRRRFNREEFKKKYMTLA